MRAAVLLMLLAALTACGGGAASAPETEGAGDSTAVTVETRDTTYPRGRRGWLIARSAYPSPLNGEWRPMAGVCRDPPSLQLLGRGDSVDLMLVFQLPAADPITGAYRVAGADDTTGAPRTARLGAQKTLYADLAYRSDGGSVELSRLDRVASGRFHLVLREITSQDTVRYLGVFERLPVDSLPEANCRVAPRDLPPGVH